jgi:hypothetical protein
VTLAGHSAVIVLAVAWPWAVPAVQTNPPAPDPFVVTDVAVAVPASARLPPEDSVEVAEGVCEACEPPPVMRAVEVSEAALVTHVAHAIVPVPVIGPPVIGLVVATLVTPPAPEVAIVAV